jgi:O-antigen/teichoic acid export membrane protein
MKPTPKTIKRTKFIGLEGLNFAIRPIHTSLISLLVIRLVDIELWGQFVFYLLTIEVITMVLNWGQRAYLMREFSLQPQHIGSLLSTTLLARVPLLIGALLVLLIGPDFRIYFSSLFLWLTFKWLANLFESLIKFNRTYWYSILAEVIAMCVAIGYLLYHYQTVTMSEVIFAFALSSFARLIVLSPILKNLTRIKFSWIALFSNLKVTLPIFAISIAALLQVKGDLYTATFMLDDIELAKYQVMISFLVLGQTIAWVILGPFQKNIYRWKESSLTALKRKYLVLGILISSVFSVLLLFGLRIFYKIEIEFWYSILFFAYVLPLYFYLIESQLMLKLKQEKKLLKFNFFVAVVNIGAAILLIQIFGIVGALISGILGSILMGFLVLNQVKKIVE